MGKKAPSDKTPKSRPTLAEIQDCFQKAILGDGAGLMAFIGDNSKTTRDVLFGVYRHAYAARLIEAAGHDYPRLKAHVGQDAFGELMRGYLTRHPSRHANVRWFGQQLPGYLATTAPFASAPHIAELAHIERALNDAFDAADAPVLGLDSLALHAPERWGDLIFTPQPAARRLDLATNALDLWRALKDENDAPAPGPLPERQHVIVWRVDGTPMIRALEAEEAMLWDEAAKGVHFAGLCELAATFADPDGAAVRVAQCLNGWIGAGMLSKARLMRARRRSGLASRASVRS
jgi:hypothetical protein